MEQARVSGALSEAQMKQVLEVSRTRTLVSALTVQVRL